MIMNKLCITIIDSHDIAYGNVQMINNIFMHEVMFLYRLTV